MRIAHRARQFWHALFAKPKPEELALARAALPGSLLILFDQLQPSEQAHSLKIYRQLVEQGETQRAARSRYAAIPAAVQQAWLSAARMHMPFVTDG